MKKDVFAQRIMEWYTYNHRQLPWRKTNDPYKIWLSEIILQQTRVAQGLPYYESFADAFPTVHEMAKASLEKVLRLWQGLGYYTRARNLHQCAKYLVKNCEGNFPTTFEALKKLPGIGPYTAAAIASISFKEPVAVVDGNVFRVLARVFGIDKDIASTHGKKFFFSFANELIDRNAPDVFNQAVMEFGALQCLPKNPKCEGCMFSKSCVARQKNLQAVLPIKIKQIKKITRYFNYFIIRDRANVLMRKRNDKDIWRGLYDFYLIETKRSKNVKSLMEKDKLLSKMKIISESNIFPHSLSHQKLNVKFIVAEKSLSKSEEKLASKSGLKKIQIKKIEKLPKPILIDGYLKSLRFFSSTSKEKT
ncbi:MAG: A/G-specific adenine glycosylase [Bacteroidetes bacterium]|nr:A/G-specific adenine glycosylase [Bacteroidota bacterium]